MELQYEQAGNVPLARVDQPTYYTLVRQYQKVCIDKKLPDPKVANELKPHGMHPRNPHLFGDVEEETAPVGVLPSTGALHMGVASSRKNRKFTDAKVFYVYVRRLLENIFMLAHSQWDVPNRSAGKRVIGKGVNGSVENAPMHACDNLCLVFEEASKCMQQWQLESMVLVSCA